MFKRIFELLNRAKNDKTKVDKTKARDVVTYIPDHSIWNDPEVQQAYSEALRTIRRKASERGDNPVDYQLVRRGAGSKPGAAVGIDDPDGWVAGRYTTKYRPRWPHGPHRLELIVNPDKSTIKCSCGKTTHAPTPQGAWDKMKQAHGGQARSGKPATWVFRKRGQLIE